MSTPGTSLAAGSQAAAAGASSAAGSQVQAADDVRELLLSTTADASDPSTPLSAPDLRLLIDRLRLRSDRLHASALSFAASNCGALANALLRAASAADSSASLELGFYELPRLSFLFCRHLHCKPVVAVSGNF